MAKPARDCGNIYAFLDAHGCEKVPQVVMSDSHHPDFFGGGDESGGDVGAGGAFAVGAGHVDYFEIVLWIAELF